MTIQSIKDKINEGATFNADFKTRTFAIGNKRYPSAVLEMDKTDLEEPLKRIHFLYSVYKHSQPSARSDGKRRLYFKALPLQELSQDDLLYAPNREEAQAELELYFLACITFNALQWDEATMGKWFYQSKEDPDLVILREWVEPSCGKNN